MTLAGANECVAGLQSTLFTAVPVQGNSESWGCNASFFYSNACAKAINFLAVL